MLGLPGSSDKALIESLCTLIGSMNGIFDIPHTLKDFGVDEAEFNAKVDEIAANAVVLSEIPEYATAVGVPARVVRQYGRRLEQLDQVHIPDPVSQEFCRLQMENDRLQMEINELHKFHEGKEH